MTHMRPPNYFSDFSICSNTTRQCSLWWPTWDQSIYFRKSTAIQRGNAGLWWPTWDHQLISANLYSNRTREYSFVYKHLLNWICWMTVYSNQSSLIFNFQVFCFALRKDKKIIIIIIIWQSTTFLGWYFWKFIQNLILITCNKDRLI